LIYRGEEGRRKYISTYIYILARVSSKKEDKDKKEHRRMG